MTRARPSRWGSSWFVGLLALLVSAPACDALQETKPELSKKADPQPEAEAKAQTPAPEVPPPDAKAPVPHPIEPKVDPKTGTTPEVPPVTPEGRIQDESNTIDVFEAAAPATVFVTQKQVVFDRF